MQKKKTILVLCTGNICRSPMAEGILKKYLNSDKFNVISAGTNTTDGFPASSFVIEICKENGIDISRHKSKSINKNIVQKSDIILVMEEEHFLAIKRYFPSVIKKTFLLKKFPEWSEDIDFTYNIDDPISYDFEEYGEIFNEIEHEVKRIIPELKKYLKIEEDSNNKNR